MRDTSNLTTAKRRQVSVRLDLADVAPRQECAVVVQNTLRIGGVTYETSSQLVVRKTRQQITSQGWVVELATLEFLQEPTTELEELAGYLAQVKDRLLVEVDFSGQLRRIANKEELQAKWAALKPMLQEKYQTSAEVTPLLLDQMGQVLHGDGPLEEALRQAPEYRLLFPPLFQQHYHTDVSQPSTALIKRFMGTLDLPVVTEARLAEPPAADGACTVQVVGWIDQAQYPAAGVRQAVRAITDRLDVEATLNLLYRETYAFGPAPYLGVQHAACHTRYEVPGVVGREVTALLTTLTD